MSSNEKSEADRLVARYLRDLGAAARPLPKARRGELIEDVRSHIRIALAEGGRDDTEAVRAVLEALGDPAEIVAAAMSEDAGPDATEPATPTRGITVLEIAALVLLMFGALAGGVGWLIGVLLLWASPRWTRREKLLGTLVFPGGFVSPIVLGALLAGGAVLGPLLLLIIGLAGPTLTALYLYRRAKAAVVTDAAVRWGVGLWAVITTAVTVPAIVAAILLANSSPQPVSDNPVTVTGAASGAPTQSPS